MNVPLSFLRTLFMSAGVEGIITTLIFVVPTCVLTRRGMELIPHGSSNCNPALPTSDDPSLWVINETAVSCSLVKQELLPNHPLVSDAWVAESGEAIFVILVKPIPPRV